MCEFTPTLRNVIEADLPSLFEHQREPEGNRMAALRARDRDAFLTHWRTNVLGNASVIAKAILDGNDQLVGTIGSWQNDGKRLVWYRIGGAFWGRGFATRALAELIADYETTRPLFAYVAVQNHGSIRVLEKCGFRHIGDAMTDPGVMERLMSLA